MEVNGSSSSTSSSTHQEPNYGNTVTPTTQPKWYDQLRTKIGVVASKIFRPIRTLFTDDGKIHFIDDPSVVKDFQTRYDNAMKGSSDEDIHSCFMRLTYTLVHSEQVDDVLHGIDLLKEDLLKDRDSSNRRQLSEKMYHLALGYYRCEQYDKSMELLQSCVQDSPNHHKASTLLKKVEDQIRRDEIMCASCSGLACCTGLVSTFAALRHSNKKKYEKLTE